LVLVNEVVAKPLGPGKLAVHMAALVFTYASHKRGTRAFPLQLSFMVVA